MKLIVGLGNFEPKYFLTRHNAGFIMLDYFVQENGQEFKTEKKLKSMIAKFDCEGEKIVLCKPLTYMNLSGEAISLVQNFYKIDNNDIFIIYDDISLDIGRIRFRANGSDGGHNGIKSVIQHTGTKNFDRLKIGIGPQPNIPAENYVLQEFTSEQLSILKEVIKKPIINDYLKHDIQWLQNTYN
ncbi:MAG: aminoacyl-tRNA hydrolase [bacterium]|nr:aminoacyl-tRNA hydrolase [bacterium]